MPPIIKLLRPYQWIKNLFVFLPIFFSGNILEEDAWCKGGIIFFAFCFASSGVYCFNDIKDVESDRLHPEKRHRPIPSGAISIRMATVMMGLSLIISFILAVTLTHLSSWPLILLGFYCILNVAYSLWLKKIAIVDVLVIAVGFVVRIYAGGTACDIWVSPWLVVMTFLLALLLAVGKRREDAEIFQTMGIATRKNITRYSVRFLNITLGTLSVVIMATYLIYTLSPEVIARYHFKYLCVTSIFVFAGLLRYIYIAIIEKRSGSPTSIVLHDRYIRLSVILWLLTFTLIIYFPAR